MIDIYNLQPLFNGLNGLIKSKEQLDLFLREGLLDFVCIQLNKEHLIRTQISKIEIWICGLTITPNLLQPLNEIVQKIWKKRKQIDNYFRATAYIIIRVNSEVYFYFEKSFTQHEILHGKPGTNKLKRISSCASLTTSPISQVREVAKTLLNQETPADIIKKFTEFPYFNGTKELFAYLNPLIQPLNYSASYSYQRHKDSFMLRFKNQLNAQMDFDFDYRCFPKKEFKELFETKVKPLLTAVSYTSWDDNRFYPRRTRERKFKQLLQTVKLPLLLRLKISFYETAMWVTNLMAKLSP